MNKKLSFLVVAVVIGIGLGSAGTALLIGRTAGNSAACDKPVASAQSHQMMIMDDKVAPANITGKLCDSLTITNMDDVSREIAFGPHENHVAYDGIAAKRVGPNESLTVTLNQAGSFHWHDHDHDEVEGFFTVTK
ncbi:MAG: hypothetical protein JWN38_530 [Candidatus Saccharibacteria bacterium]|nr:hypothetical protein [Candidatus Saccharibacteria bacterium]